MSGRLGHLARRFFVSLRGRAPVEVDLRWALSHLTEAERSLWERMTATDQAHAIEVARAVADQHSESPIVVAALLHDIGKIEAQAGVLTRVAATLLGPVVSDHRARGWASGRGYLATLGRQLTYEAIGPALLADAGSHRLVVQWAAEHHQPESRWTIDRDVGRVLQAADNAAS